MAGASLPPAPQDPPEWKSFIEAAREIERELKLAQARCHELEREVAEVRAASASLKEELRQAHQEGSAGRCGGPGRDCDRERARFREIVALMHREVEYLKKVYPLFDLLEAKEAEVRRCGALLDRVPSTHPDRAAMEEALRAHLAERDEVRRIAEEGRRRLDQELGDMRALLAATARGRSGPRRRARKAASLG